MQFRFNDTNHLQAVLPISECWQEAPAPSEKQVQSYGLMASFVGMFLVSIVLQREFVPDAFWLTFSILVFTMPIHEFIHAFSTPGWGLTNRTVIGLQTQKGLLMPYVYFDGEQPLWRFLLTGVAPTILLTLLPILLVRFASLSHSCRVGLGFLSFFNMSISGGDLILFTWLSTHLHRRTYVRQNGWKLYWRTGK